MAKRAKLNPPRATAVVIGAGTVGLSAALLLKERHPDMDVVIVASAFFANTTSYGSGGYWMVSVWLHFYIPICCFISHMVPPPRSSRTRSATTTASWSGAQRRTSTSSTC